MYYPGPPEVITDQYKQGNLNWKVFLCLDIRSPKETLIHIYLARDCLISILNWLRVFSCSYLSKYMLHIFANSTFTFKTFLGTAYAIFSSLFFSSVFLLRCILANSIPNHSVTSICCFSSDWRRRTTSTDADRELNFLLAPKLYAWKTREVQPSCIKTGMFSINGLISHFNWWRHVLSAHTVSGMAPTWGYKNQSNQPSRSCLRK